MAVDIVSPLDKSVFPLDVLRRRIDAGTSVGVYPPSAKGRSRIRKSLSDARCRGEARWRDTPFNKRTREETWRRVKESEAEGRRGTSAALAVVEKRIVNVEDHLGCAGRYDVTQRRTVSPIR